MQSIISFFSSVEEALRSDEKCLEKRPKAPQVQGFMWGEDEAKVDKE